MRTLLLFFAIAVLAVSEAAQGPLLGCRPGTTKKDSNGNSCTCSSRAVWNCPQISPPRHHKRDTETATKPEKCKPGDEWVQDCNRCTCHDGGAVCTKRLCPTRPLVNIKTKRDVSHVTSCKPGNEWTQNCNHCRCGDDGRPVCTKRLCGDEVSYPIKRPS